MRRLAFGWMIVVLVGCGSSEDSNDIATGGSSGTHAGGGGQSASLANSLLTVSSPTVLVGETVTLTLQARDASGADVDAPGLPVTFGASAGDIAATTDEGQGRYTAVYTGVGAGTETLDATIDGVAITSERPTLTVLPNDTFQPPDILDNESFETGWGVFTDGGSGLPNGLTRDDAMAHDGLFSVLRPFAPTPSAESAAALWIRWMGGHDRIWVRVHFRMTAHITSIWKWSRLYDPGYGNGMGGLFAGQGRDILQWGWDAENQAITNWIGLEEDDVLDGEWHSIEYDYWRNGDPSGFPSVAFWFDGNPIGMPDGRDVRYPDAGNNAYWDNGRLNAGERSPARDGVKLGSVMWLNTLNVGNTATGECRLDRMAISSVGRIGP
jgi:hypothetical protein